MSHNFSRKNVMKEKNKLNGEREKCELSERIRSRCRYFPILSLLLLYSFSYIYNIKLNARMLCTYVSWFNVVRFVCCISISTHFLWLLSTWVRAERVPLHEQSSNSISEFHRLTISTFVFFLRSFKSWSFFEKRVKVLKSNKMIVP